MKGFKVLLSISLAIAVIIKTVQCNEYLDICTNPKENFEKVISIKEGETLDLISFQVNESYSPSITFKYILISPQPVDR